MDDKYLFSTRKFFGIWFSNNPDVAINPSTQLLLIKNKLINPDVALTLVYSSSIITKAASQDLSWFCKKFNILPLDIDTDLEGIPQWDEDKKLLGMVKLELKKWTMKEGGNAAAASDIAKWIVPIIEKGGNYLELDILHNFNKAEPLVYAKAPILLQAATTLRWLDDQSYRTLSGTTNDILFFSINQYSHLLTAAATCRIRFVQRELIKRSENLEYALFNQPIEIFLELADGNFEAQKADIFNYYFKNDTSLTIHNYRKFIKDLNQKHLVNLLLPAGCNTSKLSIEQAKYLHAFFLQTTIDDSDRMLPYIKHRLEKHSVVMVTGMIPMSAIFIEDIDIRVFKGTKEACKSSNGLTMTQFNEFRKLTESCFRSDIKNNGLYSYVLEKHSSVYQHNPEDKKIVNQPLEEERKHSKELTWTSHGAKQLVERDTLLLNHIVKIQSAVRGYNCRNNELTRGGD